MKITITYLLPILILLFGINQYPSETQNNGILDNKTEIEFVFKNKTADTLTNWQMYLDDKIIWKSHSGNTKKKVVEIGTKTEYEFFKLQIFYDFHHSVDERKIEMIVNDELFKVYTETNETILPFLINKEDFELIAPEYFNKEIVIKFYDPINPNGLEVGIIKIIAE